MDTHPRSTEGGKPPAAQPPPDLLRRVFVPIEKRNLDGTLSFRTLDNTRYKRLQDGSIRRVTPKVNGVEARKARAALRRAEARKQCR